MAVVPGSFAAAFTRPSEEQEKAFVREAFLGNTGLIRILLQNGWRSFDARPADFTISQIDLTELFSDERYDGGAAAADDISDDWLVQLRNFSGTALDALLWRVVLEADLLYRDVGGDLEGKIGQPVKDVVILLQAYGCMAIDTRVEKYITVPTLKELMTAGFRLDSFSNVGLEYDMSCTLHWLLLEGDDPETLVCAAEAGCHVFPFCLFDRFDETRLHELLHTSIEDLPSKFVSDEVNAYILEEDGAWEDVLTWFWLPASGERPHLGPRASWSQINPHTTERWHRPSEPRMPNDDAALPYLKALWKVSSHPPSCRVPGSVHSRRVFLVWCFRYHVHLRSLPDLLMRDIIRFVA